MKQRITVEDVNMLTPSQKVNLRNLWLPKRYSLAVARVCLNADTEEYADIEFCIGGVKIYPSGSLAITDLRAVDGFVKIPGEEEELSYEEPTIFTKKECLPLLTIGEMIDIMDAMNFKNFHFYILAGTGVEGCEVGNFRSNLKETILTGGYQQAELCDVLWAMILSEL